MTGATDTWRPLETILAVGAGSSPEQLLRVLAAEGTATASRTATLHRTFLDTFDWRLWLAGAGLVLESAGKRRTLHWRPAGASTVSAGVPAAPRRCDDLPEGTLRREVGAIAATRALLPMGEARVRLRLLHVLDAQGKTTVRIRWEESTVVGPAPQQSGDPRSTLHLEPLAGYAGAAKRVRNRLLTLPWLTPSEDAGLVEAAAARGRHPGDYSSRLDLHPHPLEPAADGVRLVLRHLLATLQANVDGTVHDLDTEFLHDLRVAVRRTRSALGQLDGVLDPAATARFSGPFRWLGNVTGTCRDLDVFLEDIAADLRDLDPATVAALGPVLELLRRQRADAHRVVARALRSRRFAALVDDWDAFLRAEPPAAGGADAARPLREVAVERIQRAYGRYVKHTRRLGSQPAAEGMHRLRIDAKKLRYLLEFFVNIVDREAGRTLVRELKATQDSLGRYHDLHVQQARLLDLGRRMVESGGYTGDTLLATGRFAAFLETRQRQHHRDFALRFDAFAGPDVKAAVDGLGREGGSVS